MTRALRETDGMIGVAQPRKIPRRSRFGDRGLCRKPPNHKSAQALYSEPLAKCIVLGILVQSRKIRKGAGIDRHV